MQARCKGVGGYSKGPAIEGAPQGRNVISRGRQPKEHVL